MAEAGLIEVRVLMFPLKMHKGAKEECISVVCDGKGFEELESNYRSENQCEEGKELVEETIEFISSKGITGTPTYISPAGQFRSGVMQEKDLKAWLGIK